MHWLVAIAAVVVYFCWRRGEGPWITMPEMLTGIVDELPIVEAARRGLEIEVLCLARAMQSEEGISSEAARIAVGHAIRNHARNLGLSIQTLTTRTRKKVDGSRACPKADGKFSEQRFAKYCSTFNAPSRRDCELAKGVLAGSIGDLTGGAEFFDNPVLQDMLATAHPYNPETRKGYRTAEEIAAARTASGYLPIAIEGTTTRFWRRS